MYKAATPSDICIVRMGEAWCPQGIDVSQMGCNLEFSLHSLRAEKCRTGKLLGERIAQAIRLGETFRDLLSSGM